MSQIKVDNVKHVVPHTQVDVVQNKKTEPDQKAKVKPKKAPEFSRPVGEPDRLPQEDQIRVVAELAPRTRGHQH